MDHFVIALNAYLDGDESATDILNDLLEESGRERVAEEGNQSERLGLVLTEIMDRESAESIACDFAEHAFNSVRTTVEGREKVIRALQEKRQLLGQGPENATLRSLASDVATAWGRSNQAESRAVWAVWAALMNLPKHVAKSAQSVGEDQLAWQIDRTKEAIALSRQ